MKILLFVVGLGILVLGFTLFSQGSTSQKPTSAPAQTVTLQPQTSFTASFAIFTSGTFRIFTATMYHNLSQDVFIKADNPNVVHVRKQGITWNDFFKTLPMELTKECLTTGTKETFCTGSSGQLRFFLNGVENPNALDTEIKPNDRLLVNFGNESEEQIKAQMQQIPRAR